MERTRYKNRLLILLMIILAFNFVDRVALWIVLQDIKLELAVSDTQLGLLTGIAFALFYAVMGIPIARLADRGNRVTIIATTTAVWSFGVAACGVVSNFLQLLLVRVVVAVGEAGCIPPAHSLIADAFPRTERARAAAIYMLGVPIAFGGGFFAAGWLNEIYGWRTTFIILGLPGLALAALSRLGLKEPRLCHSSAVAHDQPTKSDPAHVPEPNIGIREVLATLCGNSAFRHLLIAYSVWYFFGYGLSQWTPAFFIRSHGLATGELGSWLAVIYGIGSGLGTYLGGEIATRYAAGNERLQLLGCAIAFTFFAFLMSSVFLAPDHYTAFGALAVAQFGGSIALGPVLGTIQTLVLPRMRAMSIALVYMFANLIGMGFGPLAAGALSDALRPIWGEESLRYALLIMSPGYFWAAWHLWRASRTVFNDVERVKVTAVAENLTARPAIAD